MTSHLIHVESYMSIEMDCRRVATKSWKATSLCLLKLAGAHSSHLLNKRIKYMQSGTSYTFVHCIHISDAHALAVDPAQALEVSTRASTRITSTCPSPRKNLGNLTLRSFKRTCFYYYFLLPTINPFSSKLPPICCKLQTISNRNDLLFHPRQTEGNELQR